MEKTYSNNNIEEIYNLMPLQEGMLFSNELNEESYINQRILLFNRKPNKKFIEETLELLSLKHEVLRTSFARMDNSYQVVYKNRKIEFSVFEYNNETEYNSIIRSQEKRPFDLEKDVLIRFSLLKGFDTEYKLMIISHHIILDGWSVDILLNDFIYIYEQLENGNEYDELYDTILFEKEDMVSYGDFVSYVNSIDHDNAKNYWKELLSDFENETILPETGSNSNSNQNGVFELIIEANLINSIYRYNKDNNVSVSTVFESAFGILLHKYLSMDDVVFGKIVSGRNVTDFSAEKIVGLLINTVPIRVKSEKDTKICDVVNSINNQNINSMSYSYEQLSEISSFTILRSKLVNILFAFENFAGSGDENDKERLLSNTGGFSNEIKLEYPLVVSVYPGKNFIIRYSFDLSKYDCDYIKSFAESYIKILNEMILSISLDTFYSKILRITCAYRNKYSWSVAKWIFIPIRTENFYAVDFCVS